MHVCIVQLQLMSVDGERAIREGWNERDDATTQPGQIVCFVDMIGQK